MSRGLGDVYKRQVLNLMRTGKITTEEFDLIEAKLKQKYGIESGCAE